MDQIYPPCQLCVEAENDFLTTSSFAKYFGNNREKAQSAIKVFGIPKIISMLSTCKTEERRQAAASFLSAEAHRMIHNALTDSVDVICDINKGLASYKHSADLMAETFFNEFVLAGAQQSEPFLEGRAAVEEASKDAIEACGNFRKRARIE